MRSEYNKSLITKYLNGQCTPDELTEVRRLLRDPATKHYFDEVWTKEWAGKIQAGSKESSAGAEQLAGWKQKMRLQIAYAEDQKPVPLFKRSAFWRQAAIWLIFATGAGLFGTWYLNSKKTPARVQIAYIEKSTPYGKRAQITLPDSSVVYLGPASKIRFKETFNTDNRDVHLEGEAYFEVVHNAKKPFIVHTGNLQTTDIGTAFKITAFKDQPLSVAVASGKVGIDEVINKKHTKITDLISGQKATWEYNNLTMSNINIADVSRWKDGRLAYNKKPLLQITEDLERWYKVKFDYTDPQLKKTPMTITLMANVPINRILEVLSVSAPFKFKIQGKNVIIEKYDKIKTLL